jgi:hypothetical protein
VFLLKAERSINLFAFLEEGLKGKFRFRLENISPSGRKTFRPSIVLVVSMCKISTLSSKPQKLIYQGHVKLFNRRGFSNPILNP